MFNLREQLPPCRKGLSQIVIPLVQRTVHSRRNEYSEDAKHYSQIILIERGTTKALCQRLVNNWRA